MPRVSASTARSSGQPLSRSARAAAARRTRCAGSAYRAASRSAGDRVQATTTSGRRASVVSRGAGRRGGQAVDSELASRTCRRADRPAVELRKEAHAHPAVHEGSARSALPRDNVGTCRAAQRQRPKPLQRQCERGSLVDRLWPGRSRRVRRRAGTQGTPPPPHAGGSRRAVEPVSGAQMRAHLREAGMPAQRRPGTPGTMDAGCPRRGEHHRRVERGRPSCRLHRGLMRDSTSRGGHPHAAAGAPNAT